MTTGPSRVWRASLGAACDSASYALAVLCVLLGTTHAAQAQSTRARAIDVERFVPALDANGFLGVPGTRTPGPMRTSFGLFSNYAYRPLAVETVGAADVVPVEHRIGASVSGQLGLGQRAAIGVRAPVVAYQSGDSVVGLSELANVAVADPSLVGRYRLLGDASVDPMLPKDGPGLLLEVDGTLPVGAKDAFAGEGASRLGARLVFDVQLLGAGIGGVIGYRHRFSSRSLGGDALDGEMNGGVAAKMPLPSLHPLSALAELRFATDFRSMNAAALEGELGVRAELGEITLTLAGGAGFVGDNGSPDARVVLGLWYTPATSDMDHDGIDDGSDQCPALAEDRDGFQDHDGCPDPDNDNDMVPDVDDLCPLQEALEGQDDDEDGCTDAP